MKTEKLIEKAKRKMEKEGMAPELAQSIAEVLQALADNATDSHKAMVEAERRAEGYRVDINILQADLVEARRGAQEAQHENEAARWGAAAEEAGSWG